ncbi:MAG TPA: EVE domain-containing protein [Steroidobacteraceae bacterium]|jgi:predicted RNA-binding protein with PUA-like domain
MKHWLIKSEPGSFSVADLAKSRAQTTSWSGVRNYQARNFLREMQKGDQAFFYHSSCEVPAVVGIVEVVREAYPDPTAFDPKDDHYDPDSDRAKPRWYVVDVRLVRQLQRMITLEELRTHARAKLSDFELLKRGSRLSVMPVSERSWSFILSLE